MNKNQVFQTLVKKYQSSIYSMAYHYTRDHGLAEDLSQEIFMKAFKNLHRFNGKSKISTWLYRIGVNSCIDWSRKQKNVVYLADEGTEILGEELSVEETVLADESKKQLHDIVASLPEIYRVVIMLYHFQNLTYKEISIVLDLPEKTIETRLYRARRKIKEILIQSKARGEYHVK